MITLTQILAIIASLAHVAEMTMEGMSPAQKAVVGTAFANQVQFIMDVASKLHLDVAALKEKISGDLHPPPPVPPTLPLPIPSVKA